MGSSTIALFVPFSAPDSAWVVRRAHTVVRSYPTREAAIEGACELAAELRGRMGGNVRIEVQGENGGWRVFSSLNDHRPAHVTAAHLLRSTGIEPSAYPPHHADPWTRDVN
jgi:hypothetical protein